MSIEIRGLWKSFGTNTVLRDVSLDVPEGELVALLGPSGCGKTTLLRILAGLETADAGDVRHGGEELSARTARERNVGFVFQHYALFRHMTVGENVGFALTVRKRPAAEIAARVNELLDLVQLGAYRARYPHQLSGGQRQRVALARALATSPRVLLLDEPFGALDARVRQELRRWLRRLHDELHVTSVFVTHDQEEALEVADRVVVMNHGKVEQVGTPEEVYDRPATPFVFEFLGHVNRLGDAYTRPHEFRVERLPTAAAWAARFVHGTAIGPVAVATCRNSLGSASRVLKGTRRPSEARPSRKVFSARIASAGSRGRVRDSISRSKFI
jgi:sulfate transport system ATP-binding protein